MLRRRVRVAWVLVFSVGLLVLYVGSYGILRLTRTLVRQSYMLCLENPDSYRGVPVEKLSVDGLAEVDYLEVSMFVEEIGYGSEFDPQSSLSNAVDNLFRPLGSLELRLRGFDLRTVETVAVDIIAENGESQAVAGPPRYQLIESESPVRQRFGDRTFR